MTPYAKVHRNPCQYKNNVFFPFVDSEKIVHFARTKQQISTNTEKKVSKVKFWQGFYKQTEKSLGLAAKSNNYNINESNNFGKTFTAHDLTHCSYGRGFSEPACSQRKTFFKRKQWNKQKPNVNRIKSK